MSALESGAPDDESALEIVHARFPEVFCYRVPPLKTSTGHRAEDWGLGNPQLTGRADLVAKGSTLEVRVFKDEGGAPAATCPVRCGPGSPPVDAVVDAVVDSSRYFVLRVENAQGRHASVRRADLPLR